jgi:hypothetical protein
MGIAEKTLPPDILKRARISGKEYAWRVDDIPSVIEAARAANLVNVGGQLQFWVPPSAICECYWVEVDTSKSVDGSLPWRERVEQTAAAAARDFETLKSRVDFAAEGRTFGAVEGFFREGGSLADIMWFVWYALAENEAPGPRRASA